MNSEMISIQIRDEEAEWYWQIADATRKEQNETWYAYWQRIDRIAEAESEKRSKGEILSFG